MSGLAALRRAVAVALACASASAGAADVPGAGGSCCHTESADASVRGKTVGPLRLPDVRLVRADGRRIRFPEEIDDGRPVILDFIFTTCTTICPVLSQTLAGVQKTLGADAERVRIVSVSIDPEQDTPARLAAYARKMGAGPGWTFYTGTPEASVAVQKAFGVFRGNKMNHPPATFLRTAPGKPWVRMEGFPKPEEVVAEYHQLLAAD